jgi:hypothetical protein
MAVKRLYFQSTGTPGVSPSFGTFWNNSTSAVRRPLVATPGNTAMTNLSHSETNAALQQYVFGQFICATALPAKTISGTFNMVMRCSESAIGADAYMQVVIRVVDSTGTTERGILYAGQAFTTVSATTSDPNGEFGTAQSTRILSGISLASVTSQAGDLLVVEVGPCFTNTSTSSLSCTLRSGDSTAVGDHALTAGLTADDRPWIEFSDDPFVVNQTITVGQATETDTALTATAAVGAVVAAGQASETDSAFAATSLVGITQAAGQATETDTAMSVTPLVGSTLTVGLAEETDTALVVTPVVVGGPVTINVGLAEETDTALGAAAVVGSVAAVGQAVETDTALTVTPLVGAVVAIGLASETDATLGATVNQTITVGLAEETDTALAATGIGVGGPVANLIDATNGRHRHATAAVNYTPPVPPPATILQGANGRHRMATASAFWEPAVEPIPDDLADAPGLPTYSLSMAHAYTFDGMNGAQPIVTTTKVEKIAFRTRIIVGGNDISFFRGIATPRPDYALIEPLTFGSGRLVLPQVFAAFERPGVGALGWCALEADVKVQTVNASDEVVGTQYLGFVSGYGVSGRNLVLNLGGDLAGRASARTHQPPVWRSKRDAHSWARDGVQTMNRRRFLGNARSGIKLLSFGGRSWLDWFNYLCAMSVKLDGTRYTIKYDKTNRGYRFVPKDTTTIHGTLYIDDANIVADVTRDISEEPTDVYVQGVTDDGKQILFIDVPGGPSTTAAPYPFTDGRRFGPSTVNSDADTDTGSGFSDMIWKLIVSGYLDRDDAPGGYDSDVLAAVRALQRDAGDPDIDGHMDPHTWAALYDTSATGYSLMWSKYRPAAQLSKTKRYFHTASGSITRRNPNFDPHKHVVDAAINAGQTTGREQLVDFAEISLHEGTSDNWAGTITLSTDIIAGDHTPGDPITADDILPKLHISTDMNLSAPLFMGGVTFHVSGVDVSDDGNTVQLAVDTRARDTIAVWEIRNRNRETRQDPTRAWVRQYRSSENTKDTLTPFAAYMGKIDNRITIPAATWTQFPVFAGQEGTIRSLRIATENSPTEFAMIVTARKISTDRAEHLIGNPFASFGGTGEPARPWYEREAIADWLDDHFVLYSAGTKKNPCGYHPSMKTDENGPTGADITGVHHADSGFTWHTFKEPVFYVTLYTTDDTHIRPGRIFTALTDLGT